MRDENSRYSWLGRSLGVIIAAGIEVPKGKPNTAMEFAQKLAFDDIETAALGASVQKEADTPKENGVGSYERFMRLMGNGGRRG